MGRSTQSWAQVLTATAVCAVVLYGLAHHLLRSTEHPLDYGSSLRKTSLHVNAKVAIIVLGGGLLKDGSLPPHTLLRVERAVTVFKELKGQAMIIPLSGGTPHKPNPLDPNGFPIWESTAAAKKLLELGVPAEKILEESFSLDTIGNAYFLRMVHVEAASYQQLIVITNLWHMPRTQAIFDTVFHLPLHAGHDDEDDDPLSPAQLVRPPHLRYVSVADGIADPTTLQARRSREEASTATFLAQTRWQWRSVGELHRWLFREHAAYATQRLVASASGGSQPSVDPLALSTY